MHWTVIFSSIRSTRNVPHGRLVIFARVGSLAEIEHISLDRAEVRKYKRSGSGH